MNVTKELSDARRNVKRRLKRQYEAEQRVEALKQKFLPPPPPSANAIIQNAQVLTSEVKPFSHIDLLDKLTQTQKPRALPEPNKTESSI